MPLASACQEGPWMVPLGQSSGWGLAGYLPQPHYFRNFLLVGAGIRVGWVEGEGDGAGHIWGRLGPHPLGAAFQPFAKLSAAETSTREGSQFLSGRWKNRPVSNHFARWNHQGPDAKIVNITRKSNAILTISLGKKKCIMDLCLTSFRNELKVASVWAERMNGSIVSSL